MEFFNSLFYFLIVLGILVNIHELGHFFAARLTGMRADIFSFGMGKRLFGYNTRLGFTFGNLEESFEYDGLTDYRFSLLPIGGYVKIAGMVDESMDDGIINSEPKPYEFRSKNALQKAFVLSAGVIMNFLLAVVIYAGIIYTNGEQVITDTKIAYVGKNSIAQNVGFIAGDSIVGGISLKHLVGNESVKVIRDNNKMKFDLSGSKVVNQINKDKEFGIDIGNQAIYFSDVLSLNVAGKSGMIKNDTILSLNNSPIFSRLQFMDIVKSNKQKPISVIYKRKNKIDSTIITTNKDGLLGVYVASDYKGNIKDVEYSLGESLSYGFNNSLEMINMIYSSIAQIFKGNIEVKQALGGPIMIAKSSAQTAEMGLGSFLKFIAALSISLALMNILPFPALDGGHLIIVLIEGIFRREIPIKVKMIVQQIGVVILLLMMLLIFYLDLTR